MAEIKAMQISGGQIIKGLICLSRNLVFTEVTSDGFYLVLEK